MSQLTTTMTVRRAHVFVEELRHTIGFEEGHLLELGEPPSFQWRFPAPHGASPGRAQSPGLCRPCGGHWSMLAGDEVIGQGGGFDRAGHGGRMWLRRRP